MELENIRYKYITDLIKYYIYNFKESFISDNYNKNDIYNMLNRIVDIIKNRDTIFISNINYTFDPSIWPPNEPLLYNNLIRFQFSFIGYPSYFNYDILLHDKIEDRKLKINKLLKR